MNYYYADINSAWRSTLRLLISRGKPLESRIGGCKEVLGHSFVINNPARCLLSVPQRRLKLAYAAAELFWFVKHEEDVTRLLPYAPSYAKNWCWPGTRVTYGAYGKRWDLPEGNQLEAVIRLLKASPNTRQAVMTIWQASDVLMALNGRCPDIPCAISLQFLLRDGLLHMIATVRSNDAWLGMPYDIFSFSTIQRLVAAEVGVRVGTYQHSVGSLHLYDKYFERACKCVEFTNAAPQITAEIFSLSSLRTAADIETRMRSGEAFTDAELRLTVHGDFEYELLIACGQHLSLTDAQHHCPAFKEVANARN